MKNFFLLIFFFLGFFHSVSFAQTKIEKRITANFNDSSFEQFVKETESQTSCYFYYEASLLDSLKISLQAKDQTLVSVLLQVFKGTDFKFAIDDQLRVFVTSDQALITQLPSNLFDLSSSDDADKNLQQYCYQRLIFGL